MIDAWSPDWSNAVFSLEERDRRWARVRALMARDGIDVIVCLPCTNSHDRGQAEARYLTQLGENSDETTVVFPFEGETTAWHSRGGIWPSSNWFADIRAARWGSGGHTVVDLLREMRFDERGTIAIAGLTASLLAHARADAGQVNWQSVEIVKREFPNARAVSATDVLGEARYVKSEEEIAFLRKGTKIAERTSRAVQEHARAGVAERHVFARMLYANADAGGSFTPMFGWTSGPLGNTYHRVEQPTFRQLQRGDVLAMEIEGRWGGYIAQIDETYSIGPAHPDLKDGMQIAWESFNRVFEKAAAWRDGRRAAGRRGGARDGRARHRRPVHARPRHRRRWSTGRAPASDGRPHPGPAPGGAPRELLHGRQAQRRGGRQARLRALGRNRGDPQAWGGAPGHPPASAIRAGIAARSARRPASHGERNLMAPLAPQGGQRRGR
ncbi:MAG TPA: M24 family metallopeptidase [Chloroflexota bacterium]|jgi:Xaa-Pro aminopeptidase